MLKEKKDAEMHEMVKAELSELTPQEEEYEERLTAPPSSSRSER